MKIARLLIFALYCCLVSVGFAAASQSQIDATHASRINPQTTEAPTYVGAPYTVSIYPIWSNSYSSLSSAINAGMQFIYANNAGSESCPYSIIPVGYYQILVEVVFNTGTYTNQYGQESCTLLNNESDNVLTGSQAFTVTGIPSPNQVAMNLGSGCLCDSGEGSKEGGKGKAAPGTVMVGDPINIMTGNKYLQSDDYNGNNWLTFRRFYNSSSAVMATAMGANWRNSFDRSLDVINYSSGGATATSSATATLYRPDGKQYIFNEANGQWTADPSVSDSLTTNLNAQGVVTGYTAFISESKHYENYNTLGQLQAITDDNGQTATFAYSTPSTPTSIAPSPNLLLTVTDPNGRTLNFTYNSNGGLAKVTLPDGGTLSYSYDATTNNLTSVQYPDGKTLQYVYNESSFTGGTSLPHAMTGIIDEAGVRYETTTYNSAGQATSTSLVGNVETTQQNYSTGVTTYPLGYTANMAVALVDGVYQNLGFNPSTSTCNPQCDQLWINRGFANGQQTYYEATNGTNTQTSYNTFGLLTAETEGGVGQTRTFNVTWDNVLRNPLSWNAQNAQGQTVGTTSWVYNTLGQVLARCDADPAIAAAAAYACAASGTPPSGVRRWTYTYCTAVDKIQCPLIGLKLSATGPRNDLSQTATYRYYMTASASDCGTPGAACYQPGDLKTVTDALGHTVTIASYDANGRVTRITDANGVNTDMAYTPRGWLASRTIGGAVTRYTYEPYGTLQTITDADGYTTTFGYDQAHRLTTITDPQGDYVQYTLDAAGDRTKEQVFKANGTITRSLSRTYNNIGQLTNVVDGLGNEVLTATSPPSGSVCTPGSYDMAGNLIYSTDANNSVRLRSYDVFNREISKTDNFQCVEYPNDFTTSFTYDALDRLTSVTDPSNLTTVFTYDGLGNLTSLQSPDSGTSTDTYDAAGNQLTHTDAKGVTSTATYDALNRRTSTSYSDNAQTKDNVSYSYDDANSTTGCSSSYPIGRLTRVIENAVTTAYCYDQRGNVSRKQQITTVGTDTTAYTSTSANRLSGVTYPSGNQASYAFDMDGRVSAVTFTPKGGTAVSTVTNISYLPFGPVSSYTLGNGQTVTRSYNANYALTDLTSPALNLHFAREPMGNISAEGNTSGANPATESYNYDPAYRLTSITDGASSIESLMYGPGGDRTSKAGGGLATGTYGYQSNTHWLTSIGTAARAYDANGNTTGNSSAGQTWGYGYNGRNRLTTVQANGVTVGTYTYNALGQRIGKVTTTPTPLTQRFDYDEADRMIGEYGVNSRDYVWMDNVLVATVDTTGATSTVNYVITDQLGTPRAVTNSAGSTIWQWSYVGNPFGELAPSSTSGYTLNVRYSGQYFDAESGLVHNGYRDYDPTVGRYLQSDPLGLIGGINTYGYVYQNPLGYSDRDGRDPFLGAAGMLIGGTWGVISGYAAGDRGSSLLTDGFAGAATGAMVGMTDGLSLLVGGEVALGDAGMIAMRAITASEIEATRQLINGELQGCVKINGKDIFIAGAASVFGDLIGNADAESLAEEATERTHQVIPPSDYGAATVGGNASGAVTAGVGALEGQEAANDAAIQEQQASNP